MGEEEPERGSQRASGQFRQRERGVETQWVCSGCRGRREQRRDVCLERPMWPDQQGPHCEMLGSRSECEAGQRDQLCISGLLCPGAERAGQGCFTHLITHPHH